MTKRLDNFINRKGAEKALKIIKSGNDDVVITTSEAKDDAREDFNYTPEAILDFIRRFVEIEDLNRSRRDWDKKKKQEHHHFITRKKIAGKSVYIKIVIAIPAIDANEAKITSFKISDVQREE